MVDDLFPHVTNEPVERKTPRSDTWIVNALRINSDEDNARAGEQILKIAQDAETELYDTRKELDRVRGELKRRRDYDETREIAFRSLEKCVSQGADEVDRLEKERDRWKNVAQKPEERNFVTGDDPVQALIDLTQTFQACGLDAPTSFSMTPRTVNLLRILLARVDRLAPPPGTASLGMRICEGGCVVGVHEYYVEGRDVVVDDSAPSQAQIFAAGIIKREVSGGHHE
jgi:hypothetical protein